MADTATQVSVATIVPVLQSLLETQGFSAKNNWTLNTTAVTLDPNALFDIGEYDPRFNSADNTFGETMIFTLSPNLAGPTNVPAGATVTEHWLQIFDQNVATYGGEKGIAVQGTTGFWYIDNGNNAGGAAAGAGTGPYYDSNKTGTTLPPEFGDSPFGDSGIGFYLHFYTIPTWDVFTPAAGGKPATESIDVANYGLDWGFSVQQPLTLTGSAREKVVQSGDPNDMYGRRFWAAGLGCRQADSSLHDRRSKTCPRPLRRQRRWSSPTSSPPTSTGAPSNCSKSISTTSKSRCRPTYRTTPRRST